MAGQERYFREVPRPAVAVTRGPAAGAIIPVPDAGLVLGRYTPGADGLERDQALAPQHAEIHLDAEGILTIRDLGSSNGTYVNGRLVGGSTDIFRGDEITMGNSSFVVAVTTSRQPAWDPSAGSRGPQADRDGVAIADGQRAESAGVAVARDVHGNVTTHNIRADSGGMAAGRDVNQQFDLDATGLSIITRSHGPARVLIVVGILVSLVGFGLFGYPIVKTFASQDAKQKDQNVCHALPSLQQEVSCLFKVDQNPTYQMQVTPWIPAGFAVMFGGMVLGTIGMFMIRPDEKPRPTRRR